MRIKIDGARVYGEKEKFKMRRDKGSLGIKVERRDGMRIKVDGE